MFDVGALKSKKVWLLHHTVDSGLWCERCNSHSVREIRFKALDEIDGPRLQDAGTILICRNCGRLNNLEES